MYRISNVGSQKGKILTLNNAYEDLTTTEIANMDSACDPGSVLPCSNTGSQSVYNQCNFIISDATTVLASDMQICLGCVMNEEDDYQTKNFSYNCIAQVNLLASQDLVIYPIWAKLPSASFNYGFTTPNSALEQVVMLDHQLYKSGTLNVAMTCNQDVLYLKPTERNVTTDSYYPNFFGVVIACPGGSGAQLYGSIMTQVYKYKQGISLSDPYAS